MKHIEVYKTYPPSDEWHDVNEELPLCLGGSRQFLTAFHGESGFMAVMQFDGKEWWEGTHGFGDNPRNTTLLTHWRELPESPKRVSEILDIANREKEGMAIFWSNLHEKYKTVHNIYMAYLKEEMDYEEVLCFEEKFDPQLLIAYALKLATYYMDPVFVHKKLALPVVQSPITPFSGITQMKDRES